MIISVTWIPIALFCRGISLLTICRIVLVIFYILCDHKAVQLLVLHITFFLLGSIYGLVVLANCICFLFRDISIDLAS